MYLRKILNSIAIGLLSSVMAFAAENSPIHWVISSGETDKVDQAMADHLYDEACRWVEDQFSPNGKPIRPTLTIRVGEACPDSSISHPCLNAGPAELYLPDWNKDAPGAIVHATIIAAMIELADQQNIPDVIKALLAEDQGDFLSARGKFRR